jgi:hypothetical protein
MRTISILAAAKNCFRSVLVTASNLLHQAKDYFGDAMV